MPLPRSIPSNDRESEQGPITNVRHTYFLRHTQLLRIWVCHYGCHHHLWAGLYLHIKKQADTHLNTSTDCDTNVFWANVVEEPLVIESGTGLQCRGARQVRGESWAVSTWRVQKCATKKLVKFNRLKSKIKNLTGVYAYVYYVCDYIYYDPH